MAYSMTGFGRGVAQGKTAKYVVEARSVNNRFCEVRVQAPRDMLGMEHKISSCVRETFERGKFDVLLKIEPLPQNFRKRDLDVRVAARWRELERLRKELGLKEPASLDLAFATVKLEPASDHEEADKFFAKASEEALLKLKDFRKREGEILSRDLKKRATDMQRKVERVSKSAASMGEARFAKLRERLEQILVGKNIERTRIDTELALLCDKSDVTEEIVRLGSHLKDLKSTLSAGGSVGRKIDFLIQEIHREVNTIGSKSTELAVTETVVELKAEIERIREQSQNLE